jgi:hypothetical protein
VERGGLNHPLFASRPIYAVGLLASTSSAFVSGVFPISLDILSAPNGAAYELVALPRLGRKIFSKLVSPSVEFIGVRRRVSLGRYIWPRFCVFAV